MGHIAGQGKTAYSTLCDSSNHLAGSRLFVAISESNIIPMISKR
jgi:hypothetical protein